MNRIFNHWFKWIWDLHILHLNFLKPCETGIPVRYELAETYLLMHTIIRKCIWMSYENMVIQIMFWCFQIETHALMQNAKFDLCAMCIKFLCQMRSFKSNNFNWSKENVIQSYKLVSKSIDVEVESNLTNFDLIFIEFFELFFTFRINRIINFRIESNEFQTNPASEKFESTLQLESNRIERILN